MEPNINTVTWEIVIPVLAMFGVVFFLILIQWAYDKIKKKRD